MNEHRDQDVTDTDAVAELLRAAGRRPEPPAAAYEETLGVATAAWQRKLGAARRRRRTVLGGIAAALVAGVAVVSIWTAPPSARFAADRIVGTVEWQNPDGGNWAALGPAADAGVPAGSALRTAAGAYAGLRLPAGVSVRIAPDSRVRLVAADEIELIRGRLYVDSGHDRGALPLAIVTPAGRAVEIGTQFEVMYRDERYRLRVREGRVRLERPEGSIEQLAGEELTIAADGTLGRGSVDAAAAGWRWTLAVAPMPAIDGQPVTALLEWVSRETGRALRYATPELRARATNTILHGEVRELDPLDLLDVMLATTDLDYRIAADGTIEILARALR